MKPDLTEFVDGVWPMSDEDRAIIVRDRVENLREEALEMADQTITDLNEEVARLERCLDDVCQRVLSATTIKEAHAIAQDCVEY